MLWSSYMQLNERSNSLKDSTLEGISGEGRRIVDILLFERFKELILFDSERPWKIGEESLIKLYDRSREWILGK